MGRAGGGGRCLSRRRGHGQTGALGLSVAYDAELLEVCLLISSALHTSRTAHIITVCDAIDLNQHLHELSSYTKMLL